jgi:hypothetical protein
MHSDERCNGEFKRFHSRPRLTKYGRKTEMHFLADEDVQCALLAKEATASGKFLATAHLVIILACESARAGCNRDRKLNK